MSRSPSPGAIPSGFGSFALGGSAFSASATLAASAVTAALAGLVRYSIPSNLGDSSLYTDEKLRAL